MLPNQSKPLNISAHQLAWQFTPSLQLTNSLSSALGLHKDNRAVALGSAVWEEPNVRPDHLSSLSHEVLEVLPRSLEGELRDQLGLATRHRATLTFATKMFRLFGLPGPAAPRKFLDSPRARPILPGIGAAPNRAVSSRSCP